MVGITSLCALGGLAGSLVEDALDDEREELSQWEVF
jgi:hypothetical protein